MDEDFEAELYEDDPYDAADESELRSCPDCHGNGNLSIPMYDDWGDVEYWLERECGTCGGKGKVYFDDDVFLARGLGQSYGYETEIY